MLTTVENLQSRVIECENVFIPTIKHDKEVAKEQLSSILMFKDQFDSICSEIDRLETFVHRVKNDLTRLESQVDIAGVELNVNDPVSPLFKTFSLFTRRPNTSSTNRTGNDGSYKPVDVFKTENYFADQSWIDSTLKETFIQIKSFKHSLLF